ncbi:hypothetical protein [Streptomyces sp. NPDC093225]|uniref:hypothetical protein n=1 Tax=Streptomyces sp. NPDC093225 TaxID=3366034 RepID=UPI003808CCEA
MEVQTFAPYDSDERIVEFRSQDDHGAIVEVLEVFRRGDSEELFVRLIDDTVSVELIQWAIGEATRRLT